MYDIKLKGNYFELDNLTKDNLTDRKSSEIEIVKKSSTSTRYDVLYRGKIKDNLTNILWSDFRLNGSPFSDQEAFEEWRGENTAQNGSGNSGGEGCDLTNVETKLDQTNTLLTDIGNNTSISNLTITTTFVKDGDTSAIFGANSKGYTASLVLIGGIDISGYDNVNDYGVIDGQDVAVGYSITIQEPVNTGIELEAFGYAMWIIKVKS